MFEILQDGTIRLMDNALGGSFSAVPGTVLNTTSVKYLYGTLLYRTEE